MSKCLSLLKIIDKLCYGDFLLCIVQFACKLLIAGSLHSFSEKWSSHTNCFQRCVISQKELLLLTVKYTFLFQLHVSKICFLNRENSDILLVCCAGPNHSSVEVWHLLEQTMPLNRIFQSVANPELACKTPKWMHKASIVHNAHLTDIARPKLPMNRTYNIETTAFVAYFACTYRDGVIKIIHRQSYQVWHIIKATSI